MPVLGKNKFETLVAFAGERGTSLPDLARACGTSESGLSALLAPPVPLPVRAVMEIASLVGEPPSAVLAIVGDPDAR